MHTRYCLNQETLSVSLPGAPKREFAYIPWEASYDLRSGKRKARGGRLGRPTALVFSEDIHERADQIFDVTNRVRSSLRSCEPRRFAKSKRPPTLPAGSSVLLPRDANPPREILPGSPVRASNGRHEQRLPPSRRIRLPPSEKPPIVRVNFGIG